MAASSSSISSSSAHALIVRPNQVNNPLMKYIHRIPWQQGDIIPDFVMGRTVCGLFLSIRYHSLHPQYIYDRLDKLGSMYEIRILLLLVDTQQYNGILKELSKLALTAGCTLILSWTNEEAAKYLESYKIFEAKPADPIMENNSSAATECLSAIKKVNKTDAASLIALYGSLDSIVRASKEDITLCPGLGPHKAERLHQLFHEPFLK